MDTSLGTARDRKYRGQHWAPRRARRIARTVHLWGTVLILVVPSPPLYASGGARCRKAETLSALWGTGESHRRYNKVVLLQEIRALQHEKHVGER